MNKANDILIRTFFFAGTFFAVGMAIYGYFNEEENLIWKFIIHFFLFGCTMGILARRNHIKKQKELNSDDEKRE